MRWQTWASFGRHALLSTWILGVLGCQGGLDRDAVTSLANLQAKWSTETRVTGRTIPPAIRSGRSLSPTYIELEKSGDLQSLVTSSEVRQRIVEEVSRTIEAGSVYLVACNVANLSIPDQAEQEVFVPIMKKCLLSEDPLIRWSGVYLAREIGDQELAASQLAKDYKSLLTRPEPLVWWGSCEEPRERSAFKRLDAAVSIAALRMILIELVGEYGIKDAKPVLRAILADGEEWSPDTKRAAKTALHDLKRTSR